jgi:hypothetical protein
MTKLKVQMKREQFQISKFNNRFFQVQKSELSLSTAGRQPRAGFLTFEIQTFIWHLNFDVWDYSSKRPIVPNVF